MSSWAERVHRRAADLGNVVTSCGHPGSAPGFPYRLEKVKFGVPLDEVCKNSNIPGPLLVLILKLNKESPNRRDVFRAPGHQGAMKKLIHFLQAGRLVNVDNYSVYTIASVLKKFLRKIPNGIFGRTGETELFAIIELKNVAEQNERLHRLFTSLPKYTQHLLVLLFGTFRVIASNAAHACTGMTSEALGVSVAPSFFQSCVSDGKTARMEDVLKFKVATKIMKHIIDKFATDDLFGRDNYEYYARVTGRILKVQDEWICSFQYPPPPRGKLAQQKYALQHSLEAEKTWLQCQCERWGLLAQEESRSTPALLTSSSSALDNSALSLGVTPEHSFIESCARLSVSLEGPGLFAMTSSPIPKRGEHELLLQRAEVAGDYEDDEENYADDDADDDDDDFARELDISNDDDIENNPKINLLKTTTPKKQRAAAAGVGAAEPLEHDELDNDDDEGAFVKRRYRQNRKKMTQTRMTQRRLRACSKSLDGGERQAAATSAASAAHPENNGGYNGSHVPKSKTTIHTTALAAAGGSDGIAGIGAAAKTRTCSRCNRGIRHSSSCSSASASGVGGAAANGSGMTMEELRAVNRYAESTKSLSYLPQVHERQTARMRTRSEWFLGPKDAVSLQLPNTCSNCYLAVQQEQQQQHGYLGGGSTRDMRATRRSDFFALPVDVDGNAIGGAAVAEAVNERALYYYYKQQRQQQLQKQQQQHYMDTDDSVDYDAHIHSTGAFPQATATATTTTSALQQSGKRLLLDTQTVGNIRLSNSAESVENPARRPSTTRRLIGINVPRQYPLRSSLRRNKEKQFGGSNGNSVATTVVDIGCSNQPPSVRNSIAECCSTLQHGSSGNILMPTFSHNRLQSRATSLEHKQAFMYAEDNNCAHVLMDTTELTKSTASGNILIYTTTTAGMSNISTAPLVSKGSLVKSLTHVAATQQLLKSDETAVSLTITFKPPRI